MQLYNQQDQNENKGKETNKTKQKSQNKAKQTKKNNNKKRTSQKKTTNKQKIPDPHLQIEQQHKTVVHSVGNRLPISRKSTF